MLSILIPVYNFDVVPFVSDLAQQCLSCRIPFEIICLDDGSNEAFKKKNAGLKSQPSIVYEELPHNVGRSKIRNQLSTMAKYDHLLFLDCDSATNSKKFIEHYISQLDGESVVYGGRNYEQKKPSDSTTYFRWWYGINRETISVETRKKAVYSHFMTNNFCIPKAVFQSIKLDESISGYGHEDTLFGIELKQKKIPIIHIENPLCHIGLEDFETFIRKTEEGIFNLNKLLNAGKMDHSVRLIKGYRWVKRLGLAPLVHTFWQNNKTRLLKKLQQEKVKLRWFDVYKLGYLISLRKNS